MNMASNRATIRNNLIEILLFIYWLSGTSIMQSQVGEKNFSNLVLAISLDDLLRIADLHQVTVI